MASDKPAKPAAEPAAAEGDTPKKGGKKTIVVAAVVVLLEVATVGLTMVLAGGPKRAVAGPPATAASEPAEKDVEVKIIDAKLPNSQNGGHLYLYDLQVVAKVGEKNKEKVTGLFADRDAQIRDHIRTIIAGFDPKSLTEPGLETLRRQISYQLEQDVGKDLVKEVLIPKCTGIRAEY